MRPPTSLLSHSSRSVPPRSGCFEQFLSLFWQSMLFRLRLNIIQQILTNGRSADPIHQTVRTKVALPFTQQMCVCPPRDSSQDKATGQDGVSRIRKGLFDAYERNVEKISEQMKAEEDGWKVSR